MDEKFAKDMSRRLLNAEAPLPISTLMDSYLFTRTELIRIIKKYTANFRTVGGERYVQLCIPLDICAAHSSKDNDCRDAYTCSGLHICKFYLLSGSCQFEDKCQYGHDLSTPHNASLLHRYFLYGIPICELRKLFQKSRSRKVSTLPKICKFYNVHQGCRNSESGNTCPHMHICRPYLEEKCKFGKKCKRNHDIFDERVKAALERHGVNIQRPAKEILAELRDALDVEDDVDDEAASPPKVQKLLIQKWNSPAELKTNQQAPGNRTSNPIPAVTEEAEREKLFQKSSSRKVSRLPKICKFYNVQKGCRNSKSCQHMHICKPYLEGKCKFGKKCLRNHNIFEVSVKAVLEKHAVDMQRTAKEILTELRGAMCIEDDVADEAAYGTQELGAASAAGDVLATPEDGGRDAPICTYNLQGRCQFGTNCRHIHRDMTYAWQTRESGQEDWQDVRPRMNIDMELTYSDPHNSELFCTKLPKKIPPLNFNTMRGTNVKGRQFDVRRLSTISRGQVEGLPLATEWRWYWLNHTGQWIEYGKGDKSDFNYKSNLSSLDMEQKYLDNPAGQIEFVTSEHEYILDFRRMLQTNKCHQTDKKVCRRPVFVTPEDMQKLKKARRAVPLKTPDGSKLQGPTPLPKHWTVKGDVDPLEHFQQVQITEDDPKTMKEYTDIENLFFKTMPRTASITSIHRVENGDLWLNYASKQEKMTKKNGGKDIDERRLFHGTHTPYVDAICRQGFDFRLSGKTTGTLYGKGSYFALNAKYSDSYTGSLTKMMFVVKVLVGDYVKGIPSYARPPLKDPSDLCSALYDSCVDDEIDPSIFVVFEFNQVYPEYLIRYI